ncbi:MAG: helix-hairpin-helix domain-containing protein [Kangiellaceae bacterium]|nr:helix-hairpin-helix domain-containing protein [Kangiellaceae bacterium]MCW8999278.1 helix-hairpin-helix domain-containing protein [Kangiellaceae bacterium]
MKKLVFVLVALVGLSFNSMAVEAKVNAKANSAKVVKQQRINVNTAGAKEIASALTGVGMKKAEAIVDYRRKHGKFNKIEELASVKGIGVATIAKNEKRIILK